MPTRTRAAESKADESKAEDAAPAEQPTDEAQQPTDAERALTEVQRMRKELADSIGTVRANAERHNDLCKRLDALAEQVSGIGQTDMPASVDLAEMHDRFDVLSSEIGALAAPVDTPPGNTVAERPAVPAVLGQVLALMQAVREIGKGGTAPQQVGGYKFRKVDDAIDAVGNAMRDVGLVLRSEVVRLDVSPPGGGMRNAHAIMRYTFVSTVDGTEHAIEGAGEGADKGDKSTSKACSMALKYALLQGLMIPVVGAHLDVESEDTRPEQQRQQGGARDRATEAQRDAYHRGEQMPDAAPPRDRQQPQHDPSTEPPEVRAAEVLRRANDGRDAAAIKALMGKAGDAGLLGTEIESYGHSATLQQHLLAVIRLAEQRQRGGDQ